MAASTSAQNMQCCFTKCQEDPPRVILPEGSRVDVRAFEPKTKKQISAVNWQEGGVARFHRSCWYLLVRATKGDSSSFPIELSDLERSMILEARKTAEYHDSDATFAKKADHIVQILKNSNYCIGFTGAGISTAAGIGDFRGINGKWTDREKQKNYGTAAKSKSRNHILEQLRPTYTHEALVKLMEMGVLKYVISQNTDGLHRLSGIPAGKIAELHGNAFIEKCEKCHTRYERPFGCRQSTDSFPQLKCPKCKLNHRNGRKCTQQGCDSYLMNTIINFGDYLESHILRSAEEHAGQADSVLVLGSTLKVSPANDLVTSGQPPNRIIICNRQTTPYDNECEESAPDGQPLGARVFGDCDRLMREVMKRILPQAELQAWERARGDRMIEYDRRRSVVQ